MSITPYLTFNGNCAEALQFYAKTLGGRVVFSQNFGDGPMAGQFPEIADQIMHSALEIGDDTILACDNGAGDYRPPNGISITLSLADFEGARRVFDALAEGGSVSMPFEKTFWAEGFGMVRDRFGIPWMVNVDTVEA